MRLTAKLVQRVLADDDSWCIGNKALYDLCRRYPRHVVDAEIVAKVWLIGRAYSASIERGRGKAAGSALSNDRFYAEAVPKALRDSGLDEKLGALGKLKEIDESSAALVLGAHAHLVRLFYDLTHRSKRSLASKYLHFHRPTLFFIYDSRAASSIGGLGVPRHVLKVPREVDPEYARFVSAAIGVREYVSSEFGVRLTPRQLDRLLLATFESRRAPV